MSSKSKSVANEPRQNGKKQKLASSPWKAYAGIWRENADFDEFLKQIKTVRRESSEAEKAC